MKKPDTKTREWDGKIGTSHCRWKRVNKNQRGGIRYKVRAGALMRR